MRCDECERLRAANLDLAYTAGKRLAQSQKDQRAWNAELAVALRESREQCRRLTEERDHLAEVLRAMVRGAPPPPPPESPSP